jgi:hypothetical protein
MANYQIFKQGTYSTIQGNLGSAPAIRQVGEKEVIEINIATSGGSVKNTQGEWEKVTVWRKFSFWNDDETVQKLINHVKATEGKDGFLTFKSGHTVELHVVSSSVIVEGKDGKQYINERNSQLLHLYKLPIGKSNNTEASEPKEEKSRASSLADLVDTNVIPADWG